jgi:ribosomal subunit interface protein
MVDVSFFGRQAEITNRFKDTVYKKFERLEPFANEIQRVKVELSHKRNPRLVSQSEKVEITVTSQSSLIRAEAEAQDPYVALDLALDKLTERLRRNLDRIKEFTKKHSKLNYLHPKYVSLQEKDKMADEIEHILDKEARKPDSNVGEFTLKDSPVVIRRKVHKDSPMSIEDAIYNMEMIDHDFYVFVHKESKRPAVIYRRKGWSYGVLELDEK